jgi:hypothetical protein
MEADKAVWTCGLSSHGKEFERDYQVQLSLMRGRSHLPCQPSNHSLSTDHSCFSKTCKYPCVRSVVQNRPDTYSTTTLVYACTVDVWALFARQKKKVKKLLHPSSDQALATKCRDVPLLTSIGTGTILHLSFMFNETNLFVTRTPQIELHCSFAVHKPNDRDQLNKARNNPLHYFRKKWNNPVYGGNRSHEPEKIWNRNLWNSEVYWGWNLEVTKFGGYGVRRLPWIKDLRTSKKPSQRRYLKSPGLACELVAHL